MRNRKQNLFYRSPKFLRWYYPDLVWEVPTDRRVVYLTFDDGPDHILTREVMALLSRYNFKATFFCIGGNVERYPGVVDELRDQGHAIGNHTYSHISGFATSVEQYTKEIEKCADLIPSTLFRPPYGRIKRSQIRALAGRYRIVMWSLLSWDFKKTLNARKSIKQLKRLTRKGSIVVFHDNPAFRENLLAILPQYLEFLMSEGYVGEALS